MKKFLGTTIEINKQDLKQRKDRCYNVKTKNGCYIDITLLEPFSRLLILTYVANLKDKDG